MPECYIRGSTIKYLRIPDEVIDMVKEDVQMKSRGRGEMKGRGGQNQRGGRGGGRGEKTVTLLNVLIEKSQSNSARNFTFFRIRNCSFTHSRFYRSLFSFNRHIRRSWWSRSCPAQSRRWQSRRQQITKQTKAQIDTQLS